MKLNRFILFLLIISYLNSCKERNKETVNEDFDKIEKITNIKEINTNILVKYPHIYLCNDIFIVYDTYNKTKCVHLHKRVDFQYLCSTAVVGEGPDEIGGAGPMFVDEVENCFWLADFAKFKLFKYPIDSILKNHEYKPTFSYNLPYGNAFINFTFLDKTTILANVLDMKDGKQIGKQMNVLKTNLINQSVSATHYKIPTEIATNNFYSSSFRFAITSKNDFVCAYNYSDMLLFSSEKSKLRIVGPKGLVKFDNSKFMPKMVETYTEITVSNGYIFCTYSGETAKIDGKIINSNKYIRVFNENREYVKTFFIDENIQNICYDKINKQIIAYTLDRETPFISFKVNL